MDRPTILLVDYEPQSIEATRQPLAEGGYRVEVATDGVAAVEAFRRLRPDLVLLEMMLPKKHGLDVCRELRKSDPARRVPIVMMGRTATGTRHRVQALDSGANEFVPKPVPPGRLLEICNGLLAAPFGLGESPNLGAGWMAGAERTSSPRDGDVSGPLEVDLAELSEEEIMARLDRMLPTLAAAPARPAPGGSTAQAEADAGEPLRRAPPPAPEARLAESVEAAAPEVFSARLRPPDVATARGREMAPRPRVEPGSGVETAHPRPAASARRRVAGWAWLVGLAACAAVVAVLLFLTLKAPPATSGPDGEPPWAPAIGLAETLDEPATVIAGGAAGESGPSASTPDSEASAAEPVGAVVSSQDSKSETASPAAGSEATVQDRGHAGTAPTQPTASVEMLAAPPPPSTTPASQAESPSFAVVEEPPPIEPVAVTAEPPATDPTHASTTEPAPTPDLGPQAGEDHPRAGIAPGILLDLSEVDSPPLPLARPKPRYPPAALRLRREADVTLRLLVDETGRVAAAEAQGSRASADFQAEATRAARSWTYRPATRDGVPVKVWIVEKIVFRL